MAHGKTTSSEKSKDDADEARDIELLRSRGDIDAMRRVLQILKEYDRGLQPVDPRKSPQWTSQVR